MRRPLSKPMVHAARGSGSRTAWMTGTSPVMTAGGRFSLWVSGRGLVGESCPECGNFTIAPKGTA